MSFRMFLVKGVKIPMALGAVVVSGYGTWQWQRAKEALALDKSMSKEKLEAVFDEIDSDKNGFITEAELLRYLRDRGIKRFGEYEVHAMVEAADETKDGVISLEEWRDLIRETHTVGPGTAMKPPKFPSGKLTPPQPVDNVKKSKLDPHNYVKKP